MGAMNVLIISPGYPGEMPSFTKGLAAAGVRVFGIGDQPKAALPASVREVLTGFLQVRSLWDDDAVIEAVKSWKGMARIHRVECLWEPGMIMAAQISAMDAADVERLRVLVAAAGLPVVPPAVGASRLRAAMGMDKKVQRKQLRFVLLASLGEAVITGDYDEDLLQRVLAVTDG